MIARLDPNRLIRRSPGRAARPRHRRWVK